MKCTNKKRLLGLALAFCFCFSGCGIKLSDNVNTPLVIQKTVTTAGSSIDIDLNNINFMNENVYIKWSEAVGLFNLTDNTVMYSKNINERLYPASTTKILTALVAIKYGNLNDTVRVSENCMDLEYGSSLAGFVPGDLPTLEQALYGLMLPSGNDAAVAIAEHISGSMDAFAELMNKEAQAIGAVNSHFVNSHGLHDENQYTTAHDLYLIFKAAMENDIFAEIVGPNHTSYNARVATETGGTKIFNWLSGNKYFNSSAEYPSTVTVLGGKTGTTEYAHACFACKVRDNYGKDYIGVILSCTDHGTLCMEMKDMFDTLIRE